MLEVGAWGVVDALWENRESLCINNGLFIFNLIFLVFKFFSISFPAFPSSFCLFIYFFFQVRSSKKWLKEKIVSRIGPLSSLKFPSTKFFFSARHFWRTFAPKKGGNRGGGGKGGKGGWVVFFWLFEFLFFFFFASHRSSFFFSKTHTYAHMESLIIFSFSTYIVSVSSLCGSFLMALII